MNQWNELQDRFQDTTQPNKIKQLSDEWRVPPETLQELGIGWCKKNNSYTFPERDHNGEITGILYRDPKTGSKIMHPGSKRGLYLASKLHRIGGPVFIPEGCSDTATLLSQRIAAIGRPSCKAGFDVLAEYLRTVYREQIVIMGENDQKDDGRWPGRDGAKELAEKLACQLKRDISWGLPPKEFKDIREWIAKEGHHDR